MLAPGLEGDQDERIRDPASLYAGLIGGVLAIAGIIGFFYSSSFGSLGA